MTKHKTPITDEEIDKMYREYVYQEYPNAFADQQAWRLCHDFKAGFKKAQERGAMRTFPSEEDVKQFAKDSYISNSDAIKTVNWLKSYMEGK